MIFPMWPKYYRERAEEWQEKKFVKWIFLCAAIVSWALYILFGWDILVLPGFLLPMFAYFMRRQQIWERDNVLLKVCIGESGIDVIDHANDTIKSTEYRHVRRMEVRRIRLAQQHKGSRYHGQPQECELIFLYLDGTYNFADLKLQEQRLYRGDENYYYYDMDVFFHPGCIALDYDEAAWDLLSRNISGN